jgi:formylglycine-generating enzyme required for sulfatase activity
MRKRGIPFFLAVLLAAAPLWTGCPTEEDDGGEGGGSDMPDEPLVTVTLNDIAVNLCYVPPGRFQRDGNALNVSAITKGFWLAQTETTQELFEAVMGHNPSYFHGGSGREPAGGETQGLRPVEMVNWYQAITFCNKLSLANAKEPVYSVKKAGVEVDWAGLAWGQIPQAVDDDWSAAAMDAARSGFRLPTEMEWMWAAMGAQRKTLPNTTGRNKGFAGDNGSNDRADYSWYNSNAGGKTHEAGSKQPNELELLDMTGNVREWCWDGWGSYPNGEALDYQGVRSSEYRIVRGGGMDSGVDESKINFRNDYNGYSYTDDALGFRIACRDE